MKLEERMKSQFSYLLDPKAKDFMVIFWVATFLSPVYRVLLAWSVVFCSRQIHVFKDL